ncbi:hypothetical protein GOP47_0020306 [Adiantum capillus-veneris]|uniref:Pentatricopeptide repeat-containing protein n=1 Tax=Adiantum capillus-veneris TaxID=13818 RepID=A0A9D4UEA2_ADICA|nr:hypothetical protein GOP47_0020306 [Adiantum capillus-veneris]
MAGGKQLCTQTHRPHKDFNISWKEFLRDPSNWWDNRSNKLSPRQPDFSRHKLTKEPLWMNSHRNPSWVTDELAKRGFAVQQCVGIASAAEAFSPSLIWACCKNKDLSKGIRLHNELQNRGLAENDYSDALITMYATCGQLHKAQALLDMHNSSSVIPWTALIAGYARDRQVQKAFDCFEQVERAGIPLNAVTYLCILKACALSRAIDKGKKIHDEISRQGLLGHSRALGNALVDMYAKCGALSQAQSVLEQLPSRNVISWSALIAGYAQKGLGQKALACFEQMQREGIPPDAVTYVSVVNACAVIEAIDKGKQIHDEISRHGFLEHNVVLGNALVDMYAKCGALPQAQSVLEKLPCRNVVSWSALIAGYAQKGQGQQALECCEQMQREGIVPDAVTYVSIVNACAVVGAIDKGKQIHDEILRKGLLKHSVVLGGALVDMYAKCGALHRAHSVLEKLPSRNVVSWNALITGYAQEGQGVQGLDCFEQMQHEGILPDKVTFLCLLNLCNHIGMVEKGKEIFDKMGVAYGLKPSVECFTSMVDLLGRAGQIVKAVDVIHEMPFPPNSAVHRCLWRCFVKMGRYEGGDLGV